VVVFPTPPFWFKRAMTRVNLRGASTALPTEAVVAGEGAAMAVDSGEWTNGNASVRSKVTNQPIVYTRRRIVLFWQTPVE
jgi:hypothetical protein